MTRVEFTVHGEPQPQGSKTVVERKGRRPVVREDNPDTRPWRERVERAARAAMNGQELRTGPLRLTATFVFLRPAGHFGTGRNAGRLKTSAPLYVRTRPDTDKLLRAVGDSITGIVCRDDAQLVIVHAEKHYGQPACCHLIVEELDPDDDRPYNPAMSETVETPAEQPLPEPEPDAADADDAADDSDDGDSDE